MQHVGVVGVGDMGIGLAANLIKAGYPVTGFDNCASLIMQRRFRGTGSHIGTMYKDLCISMDVARANGVPMFTAAAAKELFQAGIARFPGRTTRRSSRSWRSSRGSRYAAQRNCRPPLSQEGFGQGARSRDTVSQENTGVSDPGICR